MQLQQTLLIVLAAGSIASCNSKEEKKTAPEAPATTEPTAKDTTARDATAPDPVDPGPAIGDTPPGHHAKATATVGAASESKVSGTVEFTTVSSTQVKVDLALEGLTPGEHGFHIHETGDCSSPDAKSAGGHFNPKKVDHGDPSGEGHPAGEGHHAGDFGNITADENGKATASWEVDWISLQEDADIGVINRAVVVHKDADDLKSQPSGNAGARVGCGVIKAP